MEAQVALVAELQDFFRRRAELELDYSKSLDKMARSIQLRHKEQKQKYDKILETFAVSSRDDDSPRSAMDQSASEGMKRIGKLMNAEACCILSHARALAVYALAACPSSFSSSFNPERALSLLCAVFSARKRDVSLLRV